MTAGPPQPHFTLPLTPVWRLNWIHPFTDGNGRTSRAVSYLVLCVRLGYPLPGTNTIPEQIAADKRAYYDALEAADEVLKRDGRVDVTKLEKLLEAYLSAQLIGVIEQATGASLQ
jgi:Fic family protein